MAHPVALSRNGRRTLLKWHRGRRHPGDTPFTMSRIAEGMAAGASIEIDLQVTGDGDLAVLHDPLLEQSTTAAGAVARATAQDIRAARLLTVDGRDSGEPVMLLDDLARCVGEAHPSTGALLQLDFKDSLAALHPKTAERFATIVAPVASHMILSGGDEAVVRKLSGMTPGLATGYDPCLDGAMERAIETGAFGWFAERSLRIAPWADMVYLNVAVVLAAADNGFDMIDAFHRAGKTVDVWTIKGSDAENRDRVSRLLDLAADQITTDDADGLFAAFS